MSFILVTHLIDSFATMQTVNFEAIFDLSPDGIISINNKGRIEYVNSAFSDVTGYSSTDLIGIDENALNSRIADLFDAGEQKVLKKGVTVDGVIIQLARPQRRLISATARVLYNKQGLSQGKFLYFHDITHEQEADEHIKSELLSASAHKLRTPLVGILGFSELLSKREFDTAKQKEIAVTIHRLASNFKNMFDDFLDIEGLDVRKGRNFNIEKATLEKLLMEVLASKKDVSDQMKISFEPPELWPEVGYDFDKMKQVLSNIISNAVKYSDTGGEITVTTMTHVANDRMEFGVCISDRGIGISPSDLLHVGERFYRVGELPSATGSGLGIAIARSIMAIHGGRIEFASTKGQGTKVTVWLPVV